MILRNICLALIIIFSHSSYDYYQLSITHILILTFDALTPIREARVKKKTPII